MAPQPNPDGNTKSRAQILDEVLQSHRGILMAQAHRHSVRHLDADDALSDACVAFLRNYNGPPGEDALTWMKALVKFSAWGIARRARSREAKYEVPQLDRSTGELEFREVVDPSDGPSAFYDRIEEVGEIAELFGELKPDERTALVLFGMGYSYKEIGTLRGWSLRKVNRCLVEGRQRVRQLAAEGFPGQRGSKR